MEPTETLVAVHLVPDARIGHRSAVGLLRFTWFRPSGVILVLVQLALIYVFAFVEPNWLILTALLATFLVAFGMQYQTLRNQFRKSFPPGTAVTVDYRTTSLVLAGASRATSVDYADFDRIWLTNGAAILRRTYPPAQIVFPIELMPPKAQALVRSGLGGRPSR